MVGLAAEHVAIGGLGGGRIAPHDGDVGQIAARLVKVRPQPQRVLVAGGGALPIENALASVAQVEMQIGRVGPQSYGVLQLFDRFGKALHVDQGRSQIADRLDIVGLIPQRRAIGLDRFVRLALGSQQVPQVVASRDHFGLQSNRQLIVMLRRRGIAGRQHQPQIVVRRGKRRLQPQGLFIAGPRVRPLAPAIDRPRPDCCDKCAACRRWRWPVGSVRWPDRVVRPGRRSGPADARRRHCRDRSARPGDTVARPGATARSDAVASRCVMSRQPTPYRCPKNEVRRVPGETGPDRD